MKNAKTLLSVLSALTAAVSFFLTACTLPLDEVSKVDKAFIPAGSGDIRAVTQTFSSISVSWEPVSGAQSYRLYRAESEAGPYRPLSVVSGVSYTDSALDTPVEYFYRVASITGGVEGQKSGHISAVTDYPAAPLEVKTVVQSDSSIAISWKAVPGAASYKVYRSGTIGGTFSQVGDTVNTAYSDATVAANSDYYYKIAAVNGIGEGAQSEAAAASTKIPTGLAAYSLLNSITLKWNAVSSAVSYNLYRSFTIEGPYSLIVSTPALFWTDAIGLSVGTPYYYKVAVVNGGGGEGPQSAYISATITPFNAVAYTLVSIPGGTVTISIGDTGGPFKNASSTNPVTVAAFKMGQTEVTYELWYAVRVWAESSGYTFANAGWEGNDGAIGAAPTTAKTEPVTGISWRDAVVWCNAYSEATGKTPYYYAYDTTDFTDSTKVIRQSESSATSAGNGRADSAIFNTAASGFRLPTEAQWEYAARGGKPSAGAPWTNKYAGTNTESQLGSYAWYKTNAYDVGSGHANYGTHPVKTRAANTAGLYDMSGNVSEWCWDGIYSGGSRRYRAFRGGSWGGGAAGCAVAARSSSDPYGRDSNVGFRVASP
jgi:formylglycine-generating enzyme required for sulfatase activity